MALQSGVAFELSLAPFLVPDRHGPVKGGGGQAVAAGRPAQPAHGPRVTLAQDRLEGEVVALLAPQSDVRVLAAGGQQSPLRIPGATPHAALVTGESLQGFQPHPAIDKVAKKQIRILF